MIYHPLSTLVRAGITEFIIITTVQDHNAFTRLLGTGIHLGLNISYATQDEPRGIADALLICATRTLGRDVALILGDNIFHNVDVRTPVMTHSHNGGAHIFAYHVRNPSSYGVVELDSSGHALSLEEKPSTPRSSYAITGLYLYDSMVTEIARGLTPSARGELEITDVNEAYRRAGNLRVSVIDHDGAWLDTGTFTSLARASELARSVEKRQGVKIGCLEEAAWRAGLISDEQLERLGWRLGRSDYGHYILNLLRK